MWKNFVKDYLSFTKKDRIAVIVLVTLIFFVVLLPYTWPAKKPVQPAKEEIEKIKILAAQLNKPDTANQKKVNPSRTIIPLKKITRKSRLTCFILIPIH